MDEQTFFNLKIDGYPVELHGVTKDFVDWILSGLPVKTKPILMWLEPWRYRV